MIINIFGSTQNVYEFKEDIDIAGGRLYVLLSEKKQDGKIYYEYLGSMLSNLEDNSADFMSAFFGIATHYALPAEVPSDPMELKKKLDENDAALVFEGMESV